MMPSHQWLDSQLLKQVQGLKCPMCAQVHLYLPSQDHPAHDTVRAIVKDDTDVFSGDSSRVWVDSGAPSQQT